MAAEVEEGEQGFRLTMDPTDLPEEVAECIFSLLPVADVLSCCLVCSRWRDSLNKNLIWKPFCNPNINLDNRKSLVKPTLEIPKSDFENLSPLCKYRQIYMHEIHVKNNFRNNRNVDYEISRNYIDKTLFLQNYLVVNDSYQNMFHVWDIHGKPAQIQSIPYLLSQMCTQTFESFGDCLLIVQCNLLQVYIVVDGVFTLKLCRIFDKDEKFSHTIPTSDTMSAWYSSTIRLYPSDFNSINKTVGNYFIGIVESNCLNDSVMHIWNLESGTKLKEDIIPGVESSVESICCGTNSQCLYIALYLRMNRFVSSSVRCKIFCYSLKTLQYTQFYVEANHSVPFMLCEEKVFVLPCDQWENSGSYMFIDAVTGKKIVEKRFENPINPKAVDIHRSLMVFGSSNIVTVVDLSTQEEMLVFPVNFEVLKVYLLDYNMLLVGGVFYNFILEVWDIQKKSLLYTLNERSVLCGRTLPTLGFHSMFAIHVLHFW